MAGQPEHHRNSKKKLEITDRPETAATFMLRCAQLNLHTDDLDGMSMGMVYDMLIEQMNDNEDYNIEAAPGSMRAFFGGESIV